MCGSMHISGKAPRSGMERGMICEYPSNTVTIKGGSGEPAQRFFVGEYTNRNSDNAASCYVLVLFMLCPICAL